MSKFYKVLEKAAKEKTLGAPTWSWKLVQSFDTHQTSAGQAATSPLKGSRPPQAGNRATTGIDQHLVTLLTPMAFEAEAYWILGQQIERLHKEAGLRVVAISSPSKGDGKTVTAVNLAEVLAKVSQTRVLLLEADLRHPSVVDYLGLDPTPGRGLVDTIQDLSLSFQDVVQQHPPFNMAVLPAGRPTASPYEALKSPRLPELLQQARELYDCIVVDMPPLVPFADCRLMERWIDGLLIIVAAHKTRRKLLEEALNTVDQTKLIGLVFNQDERQAPRYYSYYAPAHAGNGHYQGRRASRRRRKNHQPQ